MICEDLGHTEFLESFCVLLIKLRLIPDEVGGILEELLRGGSVVGDSPEFIP